MRQSGLQRPSELIGPAGIWAMKSWRGRRAGKRDLKRGFRSGKCHRAPDAEQGKTRSAARRYIGIHVGGDEPREAIACAAQAEVDSYRFRVRGETHSVFDFVI